MRPAALATWLAAVRSGEQLPEDLEHDLKYGISETYFQREYRQLHEDIDSLTRRIIEKEEVKSAK